MNKTIPFLEQILALNPKEFSDIIKLYDKQHKTNHKDSITKLYASEMEQKLIESGVNSTCPFCSSNNIIKRGRTTKNQRFFCKDCDSNFTAITNTFLEKSNFAWDAWARMLSMTIQGYSLKDMMNVLERDFQYTGVSKHSVLLARHKILNAVYQIPQPVLTGVIQIDETHFRESQKGSLELANYMPTIFSERTPRYGTQSSALGVMGAEFVTVPVAVDSSGYVVAKVACLGKLDIDIFVDLFHDHLNTPSFICTDANYTYVRYCRTFHIAHYVRPAKYVDIIKKAGYIFGKNKSTEDKTQNDKTLEVLYNARQIDFIANKGHLSFKQFQQIKEYYSLSLARVNSVHNEFKKAINTNKTNVSSKYLDKYINFYTFIHNWGVKNGKYPSSTADAEEILIYILKTIKNTVYTATDFENEKMTLPMPTSKYHNLLAAMTSEARREFNNKYLKFNEEDRVYDFKKREYLLDCPDAWVKEVARQHGIPYAKKVNKFNMITQILKLEDIDTIIIQLLLKEKKLHIEAEDADILAYLGLSDMDLALDAPLDETLSRHLPAVREDSPLYHPNIYPSSAQIEEYKEQRKRKAVRTTSEDSSENSEDDTDLPFF